MDSRELAILANMIQAQLRPYIEELVKTEAQAIPYYIRKEFEQLTKSEVCDMIRKEISKQLNVEVKVNVV